MLFNSISVPSDASDHRHWSGLPEGLDALIVSELCKQQARPVVWLVADNQKAMAAEASLKTFLRGSAIEVTLFPDWETLPYDTFSPHEDIISQRLSTLTRLPSLKSGIVIVPLPTALQRLAPSTFIAANSLSLKVGESLNIERYRERLDSLGYRHVDTVYQHGEYAVRGSIFDVFPMGSNVPIRIELFDDDIDSLRSFDPDSQRSKDKLDDISLLPAFEFPWDDTNRLRFRNAWLDQFPNTPADSQILKDIKNGVKPHGLEYYTPLFFDAMSSFFDYIPDSALLIRPEKTDLHIDAVWQEIEHRYEDRRHDIQRPILPPATLYLRKDELFGALKQFSLLVFEADANNDAHWQSQITSLPNVAIDDRAERPLAALQGALSHFDGKSIVMAESAGRRETLKELFKEHGITSTPADNWGAALNAESHCILVTGQVNHGFCLSEQQLQLITEAELFGQKVLQSRRRRKVSEERAEAVIKNLTELRVGAPVVHIDHGVGRYRGLETITVDGQSDEFLTLEYAGGAKLYVPVGSLHLISRYSGSDESLAPLHRLGTEKWSSAKQKALEKIRDTAAELLEVYARREAKKGFAHEPPGPAYKAFCASFPFEETPDQEQAINAVIQDMMKARPMDRLVCGDVGFGKTEVAMRAAFVATQSGKQVAVLVPTTLLAQQHYESFVDRFADTAVKVEVLSRFKSSKETSQTLERIADGRADIIVGTHKLIQQDVKFKDLGLLIIDEEHRFGVQQKEKLKAFRANVDILTLTATPIPRTLNMAMGNLRDLSIISTPPAKRLSVKTFVRQKEDALIREAMLREILRGGQVYYLHNEVKSIQKEAEYLAKLVPEARIGVAHGQMRERELEMAMSDFYHLRFNVLVCSTIIETGIDIPNANTIIIERADKFGLAQLHQLRGRVGRSHHQAYAYLLTPTEKKLTTDAEKRLEAISASQDLGAGFMLATHDLEIRGAGELLGEEQSGQIEGIGFSLYMELLEQAVTSMKEGKTLSLESGGMHGAEVNIRVPSVIPEDYLPDVHTRLILYKRIASAKTDEALKELQVEMIDRFGMLPDSVKNLFRQTAFKLRAQALGINKVDAGAHGGTIEFGSETKVDPLTIVQLVQQAPQSYRLEGATKLKYLAPAEDAEQMLHNVESVLTLLQKSSA